MRMTSDDRGQLLAGVAGGPDDRDLGRAVLNRFINIYTCSIKGVICVDLESARAMRAYRRLAGPMPAIW